MASFSFSALDFAYAFFLLVPGFITYRVGRYVGKVTVQVDRFNKTAYTILSSGIALSILVIIYSIVSSKSLSMVVNGDYSILEGGVAYIALLSIAAVNGYLSGWVIDNWLRRDLQTRREKTWGLILDNAERPIEVRVVTKFGSEIHGYIHIYDAQDHGKDILIEYPQKIVRNYFGNVENKTPIGNQVYVNESDISHIYFESEINI